VSSYSVALTDKTRGGSQTVVVSIDASSGQGSEKVAIPKAFGAGSALTTKLTGGSASMSSDVPLYVVQPAASAGGWPWDEAAWPQGLRDLVKQLRASGTGTGRFQTRRISQYGVWERIVEGNTAVLDKAGRALGHVDRRTLYLADLEGTMRLDGRTLNLVASGNVFDPNVGRAKIDSFDPKKSRWVDVTDRAPWGMGAKLPLIPFRTLAHNARRETPLYGKRVFIAELRGVKLPTGEVHNGVCIVGDAGSMDPGRQFDLFVGPESNSISLPVQCSVEVLG
jgi:hypothetical protein